MGFADEYYDQALIDTLEDAPIKHPRVVEGGLQELLLKGQIEMVPDTLDFDHEKGRIYKAKFRLKYSNQNKGVYLLYFRLDEGEQLELAVPGLKTEGIVSETILSQVKGTLRGVGLGDYLESP